jgi:DHA3 family multidrug efflux protein-like MFS transporter
MTKKSRAFYHLLVNNLVISITNSTVWFALIFFVFLETRSVFGTAIISGLYLIFVSLSGIWFGSIVDHNKKKDVMLRSSLVSIVIYAVGFAIYSTAAPGEFQDISSLRLWILAPVLLVGVIVGNIRSIAMPTLVSILFPPSKRERANGLVGTAFGVSFLITSVFSGLLVGHSGMYLVLILGMLITAVGMLHLWTIQVPERKIEHLESGAPKRVDLAGTFKVVRAVRGLFALILFTTFNNFLGGVFMSLMDAYGLSMVSVETWGLLWGFLSSGFIVGGLVISRYGLGGKPLRALFGANIVIWIVCSLFTIQPWIPLLVIGCYIYLCVVPFIEAAEHTIIQKVVPVERQGRVIGFAQSIELAAAPLTAFIIGPIAQFIFIPYMTTGAGVDLIGGWFGTGPDRGMALVFTITGIIGLIVTLIAMRSKPYKLLAKRYAAKAA